MKLLNIRIAIVCISLLSCESKNDKEYISEPTLDSLVSKQIDSIGQSYLSQGGVMGLAIAVAKEGKLIYGRGFGYIDSTKTKPAVDESYFLMASISKLVCATMTLKLVEENKLTLDQTLYELLTDYPNEEQAKKIKIRHLLTHTSGLKDYAEVIDSVYIETGVNPTTADYYEFFRTHKLDFEPGTHYNYSNSGFILMAMIIEHITDKTFGEELNRIINEPTGLDIKLIADRAFDDRTTSFFEFKDSSLIYQPHWTWIKGDGGLSATVNDLALFPFYWSDGTIVSEESFADMCTPTKLTDGINIGYGIGVRTGKFEGEDCVGHTGGNKTTSALMKYYPNLKTSVIVMVNTDNSPADAQVIEGFVSLAVLKKPLPFLEKIEIKDFDTLPYAGDYTSSPNMYYGAGNLSIVTYKDDPHLYRKPTGAETIGQKLYYLGDHTFGYESFPMDRVIFETDTTGKIAAFNTYWNGLRKGRLFKKEK
jgi:CubicO group peptidase (beta-lactamase class C family)